MFRKKQVAATNKPSSIPIDRMATVIVRIIQQLQQCFVQFMKAIVNKLSVTQSKIVFVMVISVTGFYSLYIFGAALLQQKKGTPIFTPASIRQPAIIYKDEGHDRMRLAVADSSTAEKIRDFNIYFDSLQKTEPKQYDSILQSRPGLMDSIRMLTQIYYSQKK